MTSPSGKLTFGHPDDPHKFRTIEEGSYKIVSHFFETLCGRSENPGEVQGLQLEMQQQFARQLVIAMDHGAGKAGRNVMQMERDMKKLSDIHARDQKELIETFGKLKKSADDRILKMETEYKTKMADMITDFDNQTHHFKLNMCSFIETKGKLETERDEAIARAEKAEAAFKGLEARVGDATSEALALANARTASLGKELLESHRQAKKLQDQLDAQAVAHAAALASKDVLIGELTAAVKRLTPREAVDISTQTRKSKHETEDALEERIQELEHQVEDLKKQLVELDEMHAHAHRELEQRYATKLAQVLQAHHDEVSQQRTERAMAEKLAQNLHHNMTKQTKQMLHKVGTVQTKQTRRNIARVNKNMKFKDFSDQYAQLLGKEDMDDMEDFEENDDEYNGQHHPSQSNQQSQPQAASSLLFTNANVQPQPQPQPPSQPPLGGQGRRGSMTNSLRPSLLQHLQQQQQQQQQQQALPAGLAGPPNSLNLDSLQHDIDSYTGQAGHFTDRPIEEKRSQRATVAGRHPGSLSARDRSSSKVARRMYQHTDAHR